MELKSLCTFNKLHLAPDLPQYTIGNYCLPVRTYQGGKCERERERVDREIENNRWREQELQRKGERGALCLGISHEGCVHVP